LKGVKGGCRLPPSKRRPASGENPEREKKETRPTNQMGKVGRAGTTPSRLSGGTEKKTKGGKKRQRNTADQPDGLPAVASDQTKKRTIGGGEKKKKRKRASRKTYSSRKGLRQENGNPRLRLHRRQAEDLQRKSNTELPYLSLRLNGLFDFRTGEEKKPVKRTKVNSPHCPLQTEKTSDSS